MKEVKLEEAAYQFEAKMSLRQAIPLGLQHVCAMFVGNLTPLLIITSACGIAGGEFADLQVTLLQSAMFVAGIVTLVQLFTIGQRCIRDRGDLVLDQFAGGGTTLVEAKLLNRNIIGVDVNDVALDRCREKTAFEHEGADGKVYIHKGDARHLDFIPDNSIDLICTHPPYADIIQYSEDIPEDLSLLKVKDFLEEMKLVASESYRVLKKDKFCAVLMGDTRQKGHMIPMSFEVMRVFEEAGFKLKELIIKEQHNCKATGYWKTNSVKYNFLLIAHEYLFVFRK